MAHRDLLAVVFSSEHDEPTMAAAECLAGEDDSVSALHIQLLPNPGYLADAMMGGPVIWPEILGPAREEFAKQAAALKARCERSIRQISLTTMESLIGFAATDAAAVARQHDLTILTRPAEFAGERRAVFEELLLGSGRPVLLLPPDWTGSIGQRVMVGWNGRREAARAIADASPFLEKAQHVTILTIKPKAEDERHAQPQEIVEHLSRKGINSEARLVSSYGNEDGERLLTEAAGDRTDLIVVGGYGKARLREFVLGGVTRDLVHRAPVPVLLSH